MQTEISLLVEIGREYMKQLPELATPMRISSFASYLNNALHHSEATPDEVIQFCDHADKCKIATVFINPVFVALAKKQLADSAVRVGTVAGFPLGAFATETKLFEAKKS